MIILIVLLILLAFIAGFILGRRRPDSNVVWSTPIVPIDSPEVEELLQRGQKIEAIKLYRELHGTDLKDSKDAVESLARRLPSGQ
ncbi:MAG: hypothetical protein ABI681_04100 [Gemmatimonadales bacterium]